MRITLRRALLAALVAVAGSLAYAPTPNLEPVAETCPVCVQS